jgi:glycosyltransferase involved in cell wall biosynthesis
VSRISIIIPVLNESANLQRAIKSTQPSDNIEVIVVDGGSTDDTCQVAVELGVQVITSPAGRSRQMNLGAAAATGDILLFLHGDSRLPLGFDRLIRQVMNRKDVPITGGATCGHVWSEVASDPCVAGRKAIAGAFRLGIDAPQRSLRWVERGVNWRSQVCQMPYGDQGIFLRAKVFNEIGGFPDLPIMEDFELMRRLRKRGKISIVPQPVMTSARRWLQKGILKTTLINQLMVLGYLVGVSPTQLVELYRRRKR